MKHPFAYLLIINSISFALYAINTLFFSKGKSIGLQILLGLASVLGGSLGALLSIIFFDRKTKKQGLLLKIFVLCIFIIQLISFFFFKNYPLANLNYDLLSFLKEHNNLRIYLYGINLLAFAVFAVDKFKALKQGQRIRISTLLLLSILGGSVGGFLSMHLFRHKTKKSYFALGLPLIMFTQLFLLFCVMNSLAFYNIK